MSRSIFSGAPSDVAEVVRGIGTPVAVMPSWLTHEGEGHHARLVDGACLVSPDVARCLGMGGVDLDTLVDYLERLASDLYGKARAAGARGDYDEATRLRGKAHGVQLAISIIEDRQWGE